MAYSRNLLEHRPKVEALWDQLHTSWHKVNDPKVEYPIWRKDCDPLFDVCIEQIEPYKFLFSIDITDAGKTLYQQRMQATSIEAAQEEGDKLVFEFLATGVEILGGFLLSRDRPHNEVRLKYITELGGSLFGLAEDGIVYKQGEIIDPDNIDKKKMVWVKQPMGRFDDEKKR